MKMLKKIFKVVLILALVLMVVYLLGPTPAPSDYNTNLPTVPTQAVALEQFIAQQEATHKIKPDNEARIVWNNDSLKNTTEYVIVYLHGFTASQEEGDPVHKTIAQEFGCNLFLSRLAKHGIDTVENMINLTADNYWESAKEALAIGKKLGKKVILMGTSTGGTLAVKLAADFPNDVHALLLMSPNIAINDPNAWLLNNHWGLQIARAVTGSNYLGNDSLDNPDVPKYWTRNYRLEAAVAVQELVEATMKKSTFMLVKQPLLLCYYYKNEQEQDDVVKVPAMLDMFKQVATPTNEKQAFAIPNAGNHVIGSYMRSKDYQSVLKHTVAFCKEVLNMPVVNPE